MLSINRCDKVRGGGTGGALIPRDQEARMLTKDQTAVAAETTAMDYLQQALEDLDKAREKAGEDTRQRIDEAGERIRHSVSELAARDVGPAGPRP
jgi:hypothetical protein